MGVMDHYETVKRRKLRLREDHPNAVVIPELVSSATDAERFVIFRAKIWLEREDYKKGTEPDSVGYSLSLAGGAGADSTSWTENCEESAIGRALDNLGYYGDKRVEDPKCSKEEMKQAKHNKEVKTDEDKPMSASAQRKLQTIYTQVFEDELSIPPELTTGEGRAAYKVCLDYKKAKENPEEHEHCTITKDEAIKAIASIFGAAITRAA